ncbi:MAG: sulfurtransferase, partial [Acidimicrobiia bacterium]|nr:sulfurtransferase [Acidimicrobiia bacterium]
PNLRICDTRWYLEDPNQGREEYDKAHIPGARYVSLDADLSAPEGHGRHPLPSRHDAAEQFGALGIGDEHTIVAYDSRGGAIAARLWWMLRWIGHERVAVLDGGTTAWTAAGMPMTDGMPWWLPAQLTVSESPAMTTIDRQQLADKIGSIDLVDARSPERYRGDEEPVDPIAGHIPTAINLPYEANLGPDSTMVDAESLAERYAGLDFPVVYCGSGVTACHDILAMELAGVPGAVLYPGSWSDWSSSGMETASD